jgi:hypothetical protein
MQQVLDVPEREQVADIHHDRQADISGRALKLRKMRALLMPSRLTPPTRRPFALKVPQDEHEDA